MIGEREDFNDSKTNYGSLIMRPYDVDGNEINAFYDSSDNLVFVLDNTINSRKPNVLLVINPDGDKKWDEILSGDYGVDLETIRPKQDNKYQKLDIEYSGLGVYDNLIKAYNSGDSLDDALKQLSILRDSAVRHSAMMRLNVANEIIAKTNTTIVKTKESIVRLQTRLKTLRAKLTEAKKGIGRVPTKQSAAKILKLESQIEATNEKLNRAKERLKSAQRRLETATVDAELASDLLNQSTEDIEQTANKKDSLIVAPKNRVAKVEKKESLPQIIEPVFDDKESNEEKEMEVMDYNEKVVNDDDNDLVEEETVEEETQNDVKPLFNQDPKILNDDIAFKPISFKAPGVIDDENGKDDAPVLNKDMITTEETVEETTEEKIEDFPEKTEKPVLESMTAIEKVPEYQMMTPEKFEEDEIVPVVNEQEDFEEQETFIPEPVVPEVRQQEPVFNEKIEEHTEEEKNVVMPEPAVPKSPASVMPASQQTPQFERPGLIENVYVKNTKPAFTYYLLLILLIVLAVFTLWLYQKKVKVGVPVLTPVAEQVEKTENTDKQNTFNVKKQKKTTQKVQTVEEVDDMPLFLDEKPTEKVSITEETAPAKEEQEVIYEEEPSVQEPVAPQVVGDVPARVTGSGQEEILDSNVSEEDVLAKKPVYEPGSKYDEMFIAEDDYVEVNTDSESADVIYEPELDVDYANEQEFVEETEDMETEYVDNPFFDAEEAQYQKEQAELYYE